MLCYILKLYSGTKPNVNYELFGLSYFNRSPNLHKIKNSRRHQLKTNFYAFAGLDMELEEYKTTQVAVN